MYIKEVIIDGFKSYAQRTVVEKFDRQFNAITGLNGSGKSNILDSICFLLGLTNLSQVRATNLQELIYKNGQAGVTKACVTIKFDNRDKNQTPLGFEHCDEITVSRQIVVGGKMKYTINGVNATSQRVTDMFQSVQLNVNNPHFLIMQGRVTKVLNMKPREILSMIEEAAGTRMYETKRESARRTIEKKESKLKEIESILSEEIVPKLSKLKEERASYLEFQKVNREIEHLSKLEIACQYVSAVEKENSAIGDVDENKRIHCEISDKIAELNSEIESIGKEIQELERKKDADSGAKLRALEETFRENEKEEASIQSNLDNALRSVKSEDKKLKDLKKSSAEDEKALSSKMLEIEQLQNSFESFKKAEEDALSALERAQKALQDVNSGKFINESGDTATLLEQLNSAQTQASEIVVLSKQTELKLKNAQAELSKRQKLINVQRSSLTNTENKINTLNNELKSQMKELEAINYDEDKIQHLISRKEELSSIVRNSKTKIDEILSKFPSLEFQYRDPEKDFNRKKVHGIVARLISTKDPKFSTSLEVTAGGKLFNVVVDDEITSKKIIQSGKLRRPYTFIPLSKITRSSLSSDVVKRSQSLVGKENAHYALSLIDYENVVEPAANFVFGQSLVCTNMEVAKKVCFDPKVLTKCVTLDGDVFQPGGTLSGGSRSRSSSVLNVLNELNSNQKQHDETYHELESVTEQINSMKINGKQFTKLKSVIEMKENERSMLQDQLKQSAQNRLKDEIESFKVEISSLTQQSQTCSTDLKNTNVKVQELETKIKNEKMWKQNEIKKAEKLVNDCVKNHRKASKDYESANQKFSQLKFEISDRENEKSNALEQIESLTKSIDSLNENVTTLKGKLDEIKVIVKECKASLDEHRESLKACNKEISAKTKAVNSLSKQVSNNQLKLKEIQHKIENLQKESHEAKKKVEYIQAKYHWVVKEKEFFGKPNTSYDFKSQDMSSISSKLNRLRSQKDVLSKSVNMRAMTMLDKAEEKYSDLTSKVKIVENDKAKLERVMEELDERKQEAVMKAVEQVNRDFGNIFSILLSGTFARLAVPQGQTALDGLEIKVRFGDIWKESLTELSGGQRSLVALSLILAMLRFKPAPLYILDEVDAALDLSHTQNIGQLIASHFKNSQFIVVSLKDGMFNNANVLYRTSFVDGVSTVTRFTQK